MNEDTSEGELMEMEAIDAYDEAMGEWATVPMGFWRTRDDGVVKIQAMSDDHIANAVRYCEDIGVDDHVKVEELRAEQTMKAAIDRASGIATITATVEVRQATSAETER